MAKHQLQEPTRLLLTALADAPRHGYAIMQEVLAISDGQIVLRTGTLYTALDRLRQQGLVQVHAEEVVDGRLRRTYALTDAGHETLVAETERLHRTVMEAQRRLASQSAAAGHGRGTAPRLGPGAVSA